MKLQLQLQAESSECGLACLAMVAWANNLQQDLSDLRRRFPLSIKGANLAQLMSYAASMGLSPRPLRLELEDLSQLTTPCILHWDLNHFVVLAKATKRHVVILDPAVGERRLSIDETSKHFTGVALELTPNADFVPQEARTRVKLSQLTGSVRGLSRALFVIFGVALVLELFAILAPIFNQMVVDDAITSNDHDLLGVLVIGFGLLLVVQTALGVARSWMVIVLGQSLSLQWFGNVFGHLIRLPINWFEQRHLGDITSRFGAVREIQRTITTAAIEAVLDGLMVIAALFMMCLYSLQLTAVVSAAVLGYGLIRWISYGPLRNAQAEHLVVAAKENSHFLESLRAIQPLKLFGREEERRSRWQSLIVGVQNREVRTAKMSIGFSTANTFIFGLDNLLVFWLGAKLVMGAQTGSPTAFSVGMLFAFISYKMQFTSRVSALINYVVEIKMLGLHAERLADVVLSAPERDTPHGNLPSNDLSHLSPSLELRNVSFRYGEGEAWVLKNANLIVAAGECVAIVGSSGAGKTTLLKILLGILVPTEGEVLYGGIPVRQLGLANVRRKIGTVMQDDVLMTGSLIDNISFFDSQPDLARVHLCAQLAQVDDEITRMPMGFHTLVGDLGSGLSGGQKQRLLLARALYKNPHVLALDEATSHLDLINEHAVTHALARMNLTRLLIAHRPETIAAAQRVVQLREGQVFDVKRAASPAPESAKERCVACAIPQPA